MSWIKTLFMRRRIYGELSEEIREHLEEKVAELVARGMSREDARHTARREFGSVALVEEDGRVGLWETLGAEKRVRLFDPWEGRRAAGVCVAPDAKHGSVGGRGARIAPALGSEGVDGGEPPRRHRAPRSPDR